MFSAGFAEMHLAVDDAGENMQAPTINHLSRLGKMTEACDAAVGYGNIAHAHAVVIDNGAAFEDHVECHVLSLIVCSPFRKWVSLMTQQPEFPPSVLPERAILRIDGAEARQYLHNLVTADIEHLKDGEAAYGALLSPQGKILADFFILAEGDGFLIDCAASQKADLLKRLAMYRLRAKIGIAEVADLEVVVSPTSGRYRDPRLGLLGWRDMVPKGSVAEAAGYHAARIKAGLADSDADLGSGEFFPHEANFDQFGGVSFTKGCYVGQEIVSRMEHRGTARNRILPVAMEAPKGTEIRSGEKVLGTVLSSAGGISLAVLRLDRLDGAVKVLKPDWVRYDVPHE